jgi:hypothetical protein
MTTPNETYSALFGETSLHWRVLYPYIFTLSLEDVYVYCAVVWVASGTDPIVPRYEFTFYYPESFHTCKMPWSDSLPSLFE